MTQLYQQEQHTMRITIEPTHQGLDQRNPNPKATIELPSDDYTIDEVLENLVAPALKAFGYLINENQIYFDNSDEDQSLAVEVEFLRKERDMYRKSAEDNVFLAYDTDIKYKEMRSERDSLQELYQNCAVELDMLRKGYDMSIEVPHYDKWEEAFDGKCDICRAPKTINEVTGGVQFGWRVGYLCTSCSSPKTPNAQ